MPYPNFTPEELAGFVGFIPTNPVIQAIIGCGIASAIIVLRFMTTVPLNQK
jgi:hypothetical protein